MPLVVPCHILPAPWWRVTLSAKTLAEMEAGRTIVRRIHREEFVDLLITNGRVRRHWEGRRTMTKLVVVDNPEIQFTEPSDGFPSETLYAQLALLFA